MFEVPLAHLLDPARFRVEKRRWRGDWRRYYTVPFGPYYIWGATACILRVMADMAGRMKLSGDWIERRRRRKRSAPR